MRVSLFCVQTVVVDMLRDEMKKHTESEGFIIVGFPRNISQVKSPVFIVYLSIYLSIYISIYLSIYLPEGVPVEGSRVQVDVSVVLIFIYLSI